MPRHAAPDNPDPRSATGDTPALWPPAPSTADRHADLDDQAAAAAGFLASGYAPGYRYTTADWFGAAPGRRPDVGVGTEELLADGFGGQ